MPNWVYNSLKITGNPEKIREIKDKAYFNGLVFNFRAFVPIDRSKDSDGETENENVNGFVLRADDPRSGDDFVEWLESTARDDALSKKEEFRNYIMMDDENIEKFKKLYGVGRRNGKDAFLETLLSLSRIIPEPIKEASDKNWIDNSGQDIWSFRRPAGCDEGEKPEPVGRELEIWRYDNWGTSSEALYDPNEFSLGDFWGYVPKEDSVFHPLDDLLKGECFYTLCQPPIKIYKKMAADGLVFKVFWGADVWDEWAVGEGQAVDGQFKFHAGPITGSEKMSLDSVAYNFVKSEESSNDVPTIGVTSREHLDQLINGLRENIKTNLELLGEFNIIENVEGNTVVLDRTLDLNFFSISSEITDFSDLFANFDVSPHPEKGWFCKIKIDVSRWDVSNVTKMSNLFNSERVELVGLSKWDRSKVTDC